MRRTIVYLALFSVLLGGLAALSLKVPFNIPAWIALQPLFAAFPAIGKRGPYVTFDYVSIVVLQRWVWLVFWGYFSALFFSILALIAWAGQRIHAQE